MGGGDEPENLVELTPEEHFLAHQLLCKIFPDVRGLATVVVLMAKKCTGNKAYGWLRRRNAEALRGNKHTLGHKASPEHRAKNGAAHRGKKLPPHSPEHCAKISELKRGKKMHPNARTALMVSHLGKKLSPEHREKLSAAHRGCQFSPEHRAKLSTAKLGNQHSLGFKHSPETRAKMSAAWVTRKLRQKEIQCQA